MINTRTGIAHERAPFSFTPSITVLNPSWKNPPNVCLYSDGKDGAHPDERTPDDEDRSEFLAPPHGYCVYAPLND